MADVAPETLARLFGQFEHYLLETETPSSAYRISASTRKEVLAYLRSCNADIRFLRFDAIYTSMCRKPLNSGRGLISDAITFEENLPQSPVSALRHGTAAELLSATRKRLAKDLDAISIACLRELDEYEMALKRFIELRDAVLDKSFLEWAYQLPTHASARNIQPLSSARLESLASLFLKVDAGLVARPAFTQVSYHLSDPVAPVLSRRLGIDEVPFENALRFDLYPPRTVLIACVLLLMIRTKWNVSAVIDLPSDPRRLTESSFELQSVKSKTGDETPPVYISEDDEGALRAVRLAERRLLLLKERQKVEDTEQRLWLSPRREKRTGAAIQVSNLAQVLRIFRLKHGLPRFSPEQLRNQTLTLTTLHQGGVVAAKEGAGHSSLATLTSYVQGLITERLSDATNLEFQRRWDAAIRYRKDSSSVEPGTRIIPIGDGASCADPGSPPNDDWLHLGACEGTRCHAQGGCSNRRLIIDPQRVEEVVLTKQFYAQNWQRLLSKNPDAFLVQHLPGMLFNLVLHAALKRGPFRHLVPSS